MQPDLAALLSLVRGARRIVVFSGAGISTESGIPDFRGPGGVWERYDPADFHIDRFLASEESRRRYWRRSGEFYAAIARARPNAGHEAVARLGALGKVGAVITQNVDGLHQLSGTPAAQVIELHGSHHRVACLSCGREQPRDTFQARVDARGNAPSCERCGGLMKPATISFGQTLRPEDLERADAAARDCDLFLVLGSSLVVYPAAEFPLIAVRHGARLAIINLQETPHDAHAALTIREPTGRVLPAVVAAVEETEEEEAAEAAAVPLPR